MGDMVHISQQIQNDQNYKSDRMFKEKANECYLLCISGIDTIENYKIYETYMHFCRISYSGKITQRGVIYDYDWKNPIELGT